MSSDCRFCAIVDGTARGHRIAETDHTLAFLDGNPATRSHTLSRLNQFVFGRCNLAV